MTLSDHLTRIQDDWGMTDEQICALTHSDIETYRSWLSLKSDATIPAGMENVVPLLAIHKHLKARFAKPEAQAKWLLTPNKDFDNNKPLDVAASSPQNLFWLAYYLESQTGTNRSHDQSPTPS
jgi:hypothetical protein